MVEELARFRRYRKSANKKYRRLLHHYLTMVS